METVTATELHDRTSELTEQAMSDPERPIVVEKHGKPAVVLVDARYFEGLLETLDILSDPETLAQLRKGIADADAGRLISHEEVARQLGLNVGTANSNSLGNHRGRRAGSNRKPNHKAKAVRKGRGTTSARAA